ncbi:hypothetical protein G7046_g2801 [Stylonectria norvegica]|nr:hypothetical protein G7046_g2801 [Stylonectria norvegica]
MDSETESEPARPSSPKVVSRPFTFGSAGLQANSISRAPPKELKLLFRKNAARSRIGQAVRPWIIAQLQLYGVSFDKSAHKPVLMDILERAVKSGMCNKPASSIQNLEENLRREYQAKLEVHAHDIELWKDERFNRLGSPTSEACFDFERLLAKYFLDGLHGRPDRNKTHEALVLDTRYLTETDIRAVAAVPALTLHKTPYLAILGWETDIERALEREFIKLSDPSQNSRDLYTAEANLDLNRFLKKYFQVDINGISVGDRRTSPGAVALYSFFQHGDLLKRVVSRTPGLCVERIPSYFNIPHTVIGWETSVSTEVERLKEQLRILEEESRREEEERAAERAAEQQRERDEELKPHRDYAATHQLPLGPLGLQHLPGSYIAKCAHLEDQYSHQGEGEYEFSTLDIFPSESRHGLSATFTLGFFGGTMLVAMSKRSVELLRDEQPTKGDSDSDGSEVDEQETKAPSEVRQTGSTNDPWGVQAAMARRQQATAPAPESHPNRVYFQVAYTEEWDRSYPDYKNENVGYLDFDPSRVSAHGIIRFAGFFAEGLEWSIYKVSDEPAPDVKRRSWYTFDGRRY